MTRFRRILSVVFVLATAWTIAVLASGGFVLRLGSLRLSSRSPRNTILLAVLSGVGAWLLMSPDERRRAIHAPVSAIQNAPRRIRSLVSRAIDVAGRSPDSAAPLAAAIAAAAIVIVGSFRGAPYVGGSDVYGYVSQAHLWTLGTLRVEQPFVKEMPWPFAADAFTPLGYRVTPDNAAIVPIYAPGLPLIMALFERLGGREAVFYVVPLFGGLAVWATYLLGTGVAGPGAGAAAAVFLAASPAFLFQLMFPMSDVPATAWWAVALAFAVRDGRREAVWAGLAAAAAVLTRPNLVPLAIVPATLLLLRDRRADSPVSSWHRAMMFSAGVAAAGLVMAIINVRLWGSPFASGYGSFDELYAWKNVLPNLNRYPRWLIRTETPVVLLALAAPFVVGRNARLAAHVTPPRVIAVAWLCFIAGVFLSYLFHFPNDTWFWLRYVLPAFPPLLALTTAVLVNLVAFRSRGLRVITIGAVLAAVVWHGLAFGRDDGIFRFREGERKSRVIGEFIGETMPAKAVFISKLHSGSIRYYSGRLTMQYEGIPPNSLDLVLGDLRRLGYHPYIVLETAEEPMFRKWFGGRSDAAELDWAPLVLLDHATQIRIYDPAEREAATTVIR